MICSNCKREIASDEKYCKYCGVGTMPLVNHPEESMDEIYPGDTNADEKIDIGEMLGGFGEEVLKEPNKPKRPKKSSKMSFGIIGIIVVLLIVAVGVHFSSKSQSNDQTVISNGSNSAIDIKNIIESHHSGNSAGNSSNSPKPSTPQEPSRGESQDTSSSIIEILLQNAIDLDDVSLLYIANDFIDISGIEIECNISSVNISELNQLPNLGLLFIYGVDNVVFGEGIRSLNHLYISYSKIEDFNNISNFKSLKSLYLTSTNVNDIRVLENMRSLEAVGLFDSYVWDHRPLRNVKYVTLLDEGEGCDEFNIATSARDERSRQVRVNVSNLKIRTSPSNANKSNETGKYAKEGAYYYIIDEWWENGYAWYRIGDDLWIASKDGEWTTLYE